MTERKSLCEFLDSVVGSEEEREIADRIVSDFTRLRGALKDVLDAAERNRAGFPIESEEWYARRDYARIVLEDTQ